MSDREVITCRHCNLVQFQTAKEICRRCRRSIAPPAVAAPIVEDPSITVPDGEDSLQPSVEDLATAVARTVKDLRTNINLSQRQFAKILGVPRTYISKVERGYSTPTMSSLYRFSAAFRISIPQLMNHIESRRVLVMMERYTKKAKVIQ